eukprot:8464907-Alexandrium_andersonii.AAC.1
MVGVTSGHFQQTDTRSSNDRGQALLGQAEGLVELLLHAALVVRAVGIHGLLELLVDRVVLPEALREGCGVYVLGL